MIEIQHLYFTGFRITTDAGNLYHHALIAADDWDSFIEGVAAEFNDLLGRTLVDSIDRISVVFVRNLMMDDPELVDSAERQGITQEIQDGIKRQDANSYIVYGCVGDRKVCLSEVQSQNAMNAISTMRSMTMQQFKEPFSVLEVSPAHPVAIEFDALYRQAIVILGLTGETSSPRPKTLH